MNEIHLKNHTWPFHQEPQLTQVSYFTLDHLVFLFQQDIFHINYSVFLLRVFKYGKPIPHRTGASTGPLFPHNVLSLSLEF